MTGQKILKRRPRIYTEGDILLAFSFPMPLAAQLLGTTPKAIERLRARVRERDAILSGAGVE